MRKELQRIIQIAHKEKPSADEHMLFLASCRIVIEKEEVSSKYSILWFYSNWSLHANVYRDEKCGKILLQMAKSLFQISITADGLEILFLKSLLIKNLITDIQNFLDDYFINKLNFTYPNIIHFLNNLITNILLDKSIILSSNNNKIMNQEIKLQMSKIDENNLSNIDSFCFKYIENYGSKDDPNYSAFCIVLTTIDRIHFQIPLSLSLWNVILNSDHM